VLNTMALTVACLAVITVALLAGAVAERTRF
jgi:ammonia channel protein AmtB